MMITTTCNPGITLKIQNQNHKIDKHHALEEQANVKKWDEQEGKKPGLPTSNGVFRSG